MLVSNASLSVKSASYLSGQGFTPSSDCDLLRVQTTKEQITRPSVGPCHLSMAQMGSSLPWEADKRTPL